MAFFFFFYGVFFLIFRINFLAYIFRQIDGFVLPTFESTCIIKDKDIIRFVSKCSIPFDGFLFV